MNGDNLVMVDFEKYCKTCKYEKLAESVDPCNECLEVPMNEATDKPYMWEEKNEL